MEPLYNGHFGTTFLLAIQRFSFLEVKCIDMELWGFFLRKFRGFINSEGPLREVPLYGLLDHSKQVCSSPPAVLHSKVMFYGEQSINHCCYKLSTSYKQVVDDNKPPSNVAGSCL